MKPTLADSHRVYRILLADDNASVRHVISHVLAGEGFLVQEVPDGEAAWEELCRQPYDLLVTDHDMPRLGGVPLIKRLRQSGMNSPVVLVSGSLTDEMPQTYARLNIAAVVSKPFNLWEFLRGVRLALGIQTSDPLSAGELPARGTARPPHNHVLIAEDDAVVRSSLAAVLQSEGYEVDLASNGLEAVSHALERQPDLVLLDLNMPHADGWAAFRQLDRVAPLLPVIVITARPNQYAEAVRVGVDAFMEKPLNIPVLVQAIKRLTNEERDRHEQRITNRQFVTQLLGSADPRESTC